MSRCANCWHADRDPETGAREILEEEDYTAANARPGKSPPKVRVVKSCAEGMKYYKTYGAMGEHTCKKFEDATEREEAARAALEEAAADFELDTIRYKLPDTSNSLVHIETMAENDDGAFNALMDAMMAGMDAFADIVMNLNDMNIRGPQIEAAYEWADRDIAALRTAAVERSAELVKTVNDNCDKTETGKAVERFAAEFGHHDIEPTKTSGKRGKRSGTGPRSNKTKSVRGVRILRKKNS